MIHMLIVILFYYNLWLNLSFEDWNKNSDFGQTKTKVDKSANSWDIIKWAYIIESGLMTMSISFESHVPPPSSQIWPTSLAYKEKYIILLVQTLDRH